MNNRINSRSTASYAIGRRDICYVDLGSGIGSEQSSWRPCLCIQNDTGNRFSPTTIVAPLTSAAKKPFPTHVTLSSEFGLKCSSTVLCEQIRTVDKSRLGDYIGSVTVDVMSQVNLALAVSIGLNGYTLSAEACFGGG